MAALLQMNTFIISIWALIDCVLCVVWRMNLLLMCYIFVSELNLFGPLIARYLNSNILFLNGITSSYCLCTPKNEISSFAKSIMASTGWFIWKSRCNLVFINETFDDSTIAKKAVAHVNEFASSLNNFDAKKIYFWLIILGMMGPSSSLQLIGTKIS